MTGMCRRRPEEPIAPWRRFRLRASRATRPRVPVRGSAAHQLDDLYVRQSRTVDPEQRRRYVQAFEKRLLDEEAHYLYTLQWHRIVPYRSRVRWWTITPSHFLNNQLDAGRPAEKQDPARLSPAIGPPRNQGIQK